MPAKKDINAAQVEKLAALGCTVSEIATVVDCSPAHLFSHFAEPMRKGRNSLNVSIRRAQINSGVKRGNATMLIWLGKQYLGQREPLNVSLITNDDLLAHARHYFGLDGAQGSEPALDGGPIPVERSLPPGEVSGPEDTLEGPDAPHL